MATTFVDSFFSFQATVSFSIYTTIILLPLLISLKYTLRERVTLKILLITYSVIYCFFYIGAFFLEHLFPYCMIVNGYQLIMGVLFLFSFYNIYIFGRNIRIQFLVTVYSLLASIWLYVCQLLSIYIMQWVNQPPLMVFGLLMFCFISLVLLTYPLFNKKRLATISSSIVVTTIYIFFFIINNSWLLLSIAYFSDPLRLFVSAIFPYKAFLQSLNSSAVLVFSDVTLELAMTIFFFSIALIPTIAVLLLLIKEDRGRKKIYEQEQREKELHSYINIIESFNDELRKIQHDYRNILATLGGHIYSEEIDISELRKHYEEIMSSLDIEKFGFIHFSKIRNVNNLEIISILVAKIVKASNSDISLTLEIIEPVSFQQDDIMKIIRILGILLDNAIEGALECKKPKIDIAFIQVEAGAIVIHIQNNTINKQLINQLLIRRENYSTKGENRGLGLGIVYELVGISKNLALDFQQQGEMISFSLFVNG
ncbi:GHKL domain-containing protein [uncultured Enterococcus sp.]|uniref:sensor histidine kinase n=1 Tax=uncultured Enterococcus sp. TaxID=167972 RepID=UPI002AA742D0|nr:GHKL domain-containing protein [uncultured Enterococcus sp.]